MTKPAGIKIRLNALGHRAMERSPLRSCRPGTVPAAGPRGAFSFGSPACLPLSLPPKLGHSYLSLSLMQEGKGRESQTDSVKGLPAEAGVRASQATRAHPRPAGEGRRRGGKGGCPCQHPAVRVEALRGRRESW